MGTAGTCSIILGNAASTLPPPPPSAADAKVLLLLLPLLRQDRSQSTYRCHPPLESPLKSFPSPMNSLFRCLNQIGSFSWIQSTLTWRKGGGGASAAESRMNPSIAHRFIFYYCYFFVCFISISLPFHLQSNSFELGSVENDVTSAASCRRFHRSPFPCGIFLVGNFVLVPDRFNSGSRVEMFDSDYLHGD